MSTRKSGSKGQNGHYEVGYGRPPQHSRFKPGQSGNPKGRAKGLCNFKKDLEAMLKAPVKVTRDGKPLKISTQKAMLLRLREKGLGGDSRALDRFLQLAQTYNNGEEVAASDGGLSTDDASILEVFKARLLSGAADTGEASGEWGEAPSSTDPPKPGQSRGGGLPRYKPSKGKAGSAAPGKRK